MTNLIKFLLFVFGISALAITLHKRRVAKRNRLKFTVLETNFEDEQPFVKIQVLGQMAINIRPGQNAELTLPDGHELEVTYQNLQERSSTEAGTPNTLVILKHQDGQVTLRIDWAARTTTQENARTHKEA